MNTFQQIATKIFDLQLLLLMTIHNVMQLCKKRSNTVFNGTIL